MTYTFKLARRLAVLRDCAMLAILAVVAACTGDTTTAPAGAESSPTQAAILSVSPRLVTAEVNQAVRFRGMERTFRGEAVTPATVWRSTGGTITANGTFSSSLTGTFKVIGRGRGRKADTAVVVVVPPAPEVTRLVVSPDATTLQAGATHAFSATAYLADGTTTTMGVNWAATGGAIDAAGAYTAGAAAGNYRVIAANTAGTLADTATVAIDAPPPAPAPTLTNVYVTPASVTLGAGGTQTFKAYGRNSVGDSIPVTVAFSATGGSVSSGGLYTAGTTGGTFRLIAKESTTGAADTSAVTVVAASGTGSLPSELGVPFGPFAFWSTSTTIKWGPAPLTASIGANSPGGIVTQIAAARTMGHKLVLCMAGCAHAPVTTNNAFDLAKWKAVIATYNTAAIRSAVAAGVSDGTVIGNSLIDEPEHSSWGGVPTKPMLDAMATYAKQYFPTLPMGVQMGGQASYTWRTAERFRVVDFTINQYSWRLFSGDAAAYRAKVLAQAALEGVTPAFSLNILAGGVPDNDGTYDCTGAGQAGIGVNGTNCRMTATQLRDFGRALGPSGCVLTMWTYDANFFGRSDNQQAFRDVASTLATAPRKACRRS
jgi:hypothetical protein